MMYLVEGKYLGSIYEAHVNVREDDDGILDVDFATNLGWIDDVVCCLHTEIPTEVQEELLGLAVEEYRRDDGADAVYDAMRDGEWR